MIPDDLLWRSVKSVVVFFNDDIHTVQLHSNRTRADFSLILMSYITTVSITHCWWMVLGETYDSVILWRPSYFWFLFQTAGHLHNSYKLTKLKNMKTLVPVLLRYPKSVKPPHFKALLTGLFVVFCYLQECLPLEVKCNCW